MRNELSKIELTELYLLGKMSEADKRAFESEMQQDEELDEDVKLQALLIESIALSAFTTEMVAMHGKLSAPAGKPFFGKLFWYGLSGLLLLAGITALFLINNDPEKGENKQSTFNSEQDNGGNEEEVKILSSGDLHLSENTDPMPESNRLASYVKTNRNQSRTRKLKGNGIYADRESFLPVLHTEKMNPSMDFTFQMADSKSNVRIPANSILDKYGRPAKGEVEIRYREYRDAADMAFSGIPMLHKENGEIFNFNSAGMFEINAYQDGEKLALNPEKPMEIDFKVTQQLEDLYFWNLNGDTWEKEGEITFASTNNLLFRPKIVRDTVEVATTQQIPEKYLRNTNPKLVVNIRSTFGDEIDPVKVVFKAPGFAKNEIYGQYINYTDTGWVIESAYLNDNSLRIIAEGYKTLKVKNIVSEPGYWSRLDGKLQPKKKSGVVGKIGRRFTSKERKELMKIKGNYDFKKNVGALPKDTAQTYRDSVSMAKVGIEYNSSSYDTSFATMAKTFSGLRVKSFGTFNCDQLYRLDNLVAIRPTFKDEDGNPISGSGTLSVVSKQINGAFTYGQHEFSSSNKKTVLLLFTDQKKIYAMQEKDFNALKIQDSGAYNFVMKDMTSELRDSKDLKKFLGL